MLNFKQIFSKGLISQCRNTFATSRVRNYFEIDPIFPDKNDPDKLLDVKRMPFLEIQKKEIKQKNAYIEHAIQEAHKKFPDVDLAKLEEGKRKKTRLQKIQKRDEFIKKLASTILEDPDLGLPYGFGFDEYIQQLKLTRLSSSNDVFLYTLNNLFSKLDATSDIELVEMHRTAVINKTKEDFKERARAIVLEHVVKHVSQQREKKTSSRRVLRKLIPNDEVLAKAISSPQLDEATIEEIEANIDPQTIENAAENLANEAITHTINLHREARLKTKRQPEHIEVREIFDETFMGGKVFNTTRNMGFFDDIINVGPQPYPAETYGKNDEEFRKFEMRLEAHDKFVERRDQLIDALYKPVPKMRVKIPKRIGKKRKAELLKKQNRDVDQIDKNRFFHSLTGDQFVEGLEFKLGLNEKTTKTYSEIFEDLDKVLVNAPLSIKKIVSEHADKRNDKFTPQFAHLSINPDEFFWGRVKDVLKPVIPDRFKKDARYATAPSMEQVLSKSFPQTTRAKRKNRPVAEDKYKPDPIGQVQKVDFDVSELTPEMNREIEIFRQVRREPYFKHYLTNELSFYSDRMNDQMALLYAGVYDVAGRPNDYPQFEKPQLDLIEKAVIKQAQLEPVLYNGKAFAGGRRKTAKALAVVKEGTGKIHINRKTFVDYFGTTSIRGLIIEPLLCSGYGVGVDVDFFIWGGGIHAQAEAASLALAKALIKFNPVVKVSMRENGLLNKDPRSTERKHVGRYKARAKFPYQRR